MGILAIAVSAFYGYRYATRIKPRPELLKDVTILTASYDGYEELWDPHYHFFFKYWPSLLHEHSFIPILLLTNEKEYDHPRVQSLKVGPDTTWSQNMLNALESVKTKYVLIILDDYILHKKVDEERFIELLTLLEETNGAFVEVKQGSYAVYIDPDRKPAPGVKEVVIRGRGPKSEHRNSLQTAIWDVEEFRKLLDPKENPWEFELQGNERSKSNPRPFYATMGRPVFEFLNAMDKRFYKKDVVEWINKQGYSFNPVNFPVSTTE
jgi:hypothetical protein